MTQYEITTTLGTQRALAHLTIECSQKYPGSVSQNHIDWAEDMIDSEMTFDEAVAINDYQNQLIFDIARLAFQSVKHNQPGFMDIACNALRTLNHLKESAPFAKECIDDHMMAIKDHVYEIAITRGKCLPNGTLPPEWAANLMEGES